jgi:uncharacterized protein involved in outer membrane biogenesis
MKKTILIIASIAVLALAIFLWRVIANLDSIVAGMIENVGSDVLKTKVSVSGVSINLKDGKASIAGLSVANPPGYSNANIFELNGIEVDLKLGSIGKDVLVIESIRVDNPQVVFEGDEDGGSNMQTLLDNIDSSPSGDSSSGKAQGEAAKMIIEQFEFSGGQVKASTAVKPGEVVDINLPAIKMSGIGKAEGGVTADVVAKQISTKLVKTVIREAAKQSLNKVIEKKTKGLLDKLKESN